MSNDPWGRFEAVPAACAVIDRGSGRLLDVNAAFLELLGLERDEALTRTFAGLLTLAGRIYNETHVLPMLDLNGRVDEVSVELVAAAGERVPVLLNAALPEDGSTIQVAMFAAGARRQYETELLRATREAQGARSRADELARSLQETLIPPVPPTIPGLGVSALYRPAGAGDEVGGDFYDVFQVGAREWVVVLGDVSGKGVAAAMVTAFIRHTVRDLAMQVGDPASLLDSLDRALRERATDRFCTVVLLRLTRTPTGWDITGAAGGHPLPLLHHPGVGVRELGTPGSPIGLVDDPVFTSFSHQLLRDELITLYTDGITEAKRGRDLFGDEALRALVDREAHEPSEVTQQVVDAALTYQDGHPRDDIAVLTLYPV